MARLPAVDLPRRRALGAGALLGLSTILVTGLATGLTIGPRSALAAPAAGRPDEVSAALPAAQLLGTATMRFLGWRVYDARLWVEPGFSPQRFDGLGFALELEYARKLDGMAIAKRSVEEMQRQGPMAEAQAERWRAAMVQAFPDVAAGDRITGLHLAAGGTRFFHNARLTQQIDGQAFAQRFFGIWLSPATSEPALRRQLLGPLA